MLFVLYKNSGVHSGRALRKQLAGTYDGKVLGGYPKRFEKIVKREGEPEYVINLGTTEEYPNLGATILNNREMVRTSSNKKAARRTFAEEGIPAPALYLRASEIPDDGFPVVGRTSYHSKGQGFWFCKDRTAANRAVKAGATHFMEFVPNTREYRVHTFIKAKAIENEERKPEDYVSVKISEKVWTGEGSPDPDEPQKNHEFGWTFLGPQNRREEELDVVRNVAKQAIAALQMDFGAVDVMYRVRNKRPYVLEVNSTPSLSDDNADTCERYANRILKTLGKLKEE
jgi:glutathione synthase/RimK-type ligase-like ATP-grasp enzyme